MVKANKIFRMIMLLSYIAFNEAESVDLYSREESRNLLLMGVVIIVGTPPNNSLPCSPKIAWEQGQE